MFKITQVYYLVLLYLGELEGSAGFSLSRLKPSGGLTLTSSPGEEFCSRLILIVG